jgi:NarL family two-component system sensor histidine kinase LiaS
LSQRLHWKLALDYVLITATACFVIQVLIAIGLVLAEYPVINRLQQEDFLSGYIRTRIEGDVLPLLRPAFIIRDGETLEVGLQQLQTVQIEGRVVDLIVQPTGWIFAFDGSERPLAALAIGDGNTSPDRINEEAAWEYVTTTADHASEQSFYNENHFIYTFPLHENNQYLGSVGLVIRSLDYSTWLISYLEVIARSIIITSLPIATIAGIIGLIFGWLATRSVKRRLNHLSDVTAHWQEGDFTVAIDDPRKDEIGVLASRLNRMSRQFQTLMRTHQHFAVLEERNRLARELHDTVKQKAFAASAQLGAAAQSLGTHPRRTRTYLSTAEELIDTVRSELTEIVDELHPTRIQHSSLDQSLSRYIETWTDRTGIDVHTVIDRELVFSPAERLALYRITQEALANIRRHSQATRVEVRLHTADGNRQLEITDNGIGFDPDSIEKGFGLLSMQERVSYFSYAALTLDSEPTRGTTVQVSFQSFEAVL